VPEFSQFTLGLVRQALDGLPPDTALTPFEVQQFWKQRLFDFGFPQVFIDTASSSYSFNWTEIIPELFTGRFGDKNSHFGRLLPAYFSELAIKKLVALALAQSKNSSLVNKLRRSLEADGFDISTESLENSDIASELETASSEQQRGQPMTAIQVFISHSSRDQRIAAGLTELLKNALGISPETIRCTSVDGHRLSAGAKTDETLKRELLNAKSFIALLTEHSLNSTWVLFELGARWGAERHLAPVFAAGLTAEKLRGPLPGISGLSCDSENQIHQLVHDIAGVLGTDVRKTHFYSNYVSALMKASAEAAARRSL
jgi:TIR domain